MEQLVSRRVSLPLHNIRLSDIVRRVSPRISPVFPEYDSTPETCIISLSYEFLYIIHLGSPPYPSCCDVHKRLVFLPLVRLILSGRGRPSPAAPLLTPSPPVFPQDIGLFFADVLHFAPDVNSVHLLAIRSPSYAFYIPRDLSKSRRRERERAGHCPSHALYRTGFTPPIFLVTAVIRISYDDSKSEEMRNGAGMISWRRVLR